MSKKEKAPKVPKAPKAPKPEGAVTRPRKPLLDQAIALFAKAQAMASKVETFSQDDAGSIVEAIGGELSNLLKEAGEALATLKATGFTPPAKSSTKEPTGFKEGDPVKLTDKAAPKYALAYSEIERHTMVYGFFDPVLKVVSCTADERTMFVKPRAIEKRA